MKLPDASVELHYDIEGEPALDVDYLHGLLIVERGKEPRYVSFVAEQPENEGEVFGRFVAELAGFLAQHPKVPIYHYHWYERTHVSKLFERYPRQAVEGDVLLDRFVDLHAMLKAAFVLPVEGYGLKAVSRWLGMNAG